MSKLTTIVINGMKFVIGLEWKTLSFSRNYLKEVKRIANEENEKIDNKNEKLSVVAIREIENKGVPTIQAGYATKEIDVRGCFSFALSVVSAIKELAKKEGNKINEGKWITVFPFDDDSYVVVASINGTIVPWTDRVIGKDAVTKEINSLKSRLSQDIDSGEISIFGPDEIDLVNYVLDLNSILTKGLLTRKWLFWNLKHNDLVLRPLKFGLTKKQCVIAAVVFLLIIIGLILLNEYNNRVEAEKRRQQALVRERQEQINKEAKNKALMENMRHPWIEQPSVSQYIKACDVFYKRIDLSLEGWKPVRIDCGEMDKLEPAGKTTVNIKYYRSDNSAVGIMEFKRAAIEHFGVVPTFSYVESTVASIALKIDTPAYGDDPLGNIDERVDKVITILQRINIIPSLKSIPKPSPKLDSDGMELPPQKWSGVNFEYTSNIPPRMIFNDNDDLLGTRIVSISSVINDGQVKYSVKGVIYGD
ncbi:type 4b pilus protein PilO2 [Pectobacterium carotovorum]|uniref:type 4b pilus protein PilO2 n=1 Tax=Pectobacterium carotovorum TaxID=554 RepID=UPI000503FD29|nr:type 4b pilus protein PilO2 [Pectobacterium carotovorum]KFW97751.1 hypothetical protein JV33_20630 [Pectobacterium carotovorum subsp. carotovorum]KML64976.1 hypothetical protein G032_21195 [Pectobacterium carotovorum subsp. carotovorum ICMP 5702]SHH69210.1 Pilin accessory protein (PilO) [Pectobacterium carotovorum]